MGMLRVLHCIVGMNRGGLETMTMNLYRNIDRTKVQFDFLVSIDGVYDDEIRSLGGSVHRIPFISKAPFTYAKILRSYFVQHPEYNMIHIQMDKFGGIVAKQAKIAGVPVRIIHSHSTKNEGNFLVRAVKNYYGRFVCDATHYMACSKDAAKWMFGADSENAIIVKNGIDLSTFFPRDYRKRNQFTVGHIGRFNQAKNHMFLIDIFFDLYQKDKTARLILAGDGPERKRVEKRVTKLRISDAVDFLGEISDVPSCLGMMDVFCMPSFHEGLPVTLIEAQAIGVPCVVSNRITLDCNITGNMEFISLTEPAGYWADHLLYFKSAQRNNTHAKITNEGYDISNVAKMLERFYLSLL